jgi:regulator of replication initiation timing
MTTFQAVQGAFQLTKDAVHSLQVQTEVQKSLDDILRHVNARLEEEERLKLESENATITRQLTVAEAEWPALLQAAQTQQQQLEHQHQEIERHFISLTETRSALVEEIAVLSSEEALRAEREDSWLDRRDMFNFPHFHGLECFIRLIIKTSFLF